MGGNPKGHGEKGQLCHTVCSQAREERLVSLAFGTVLVRARKVMDGRA